MAHGDWARPHLCKLAWHGFSRDHVWRGRSKPGCRIVGSVTIVVDHRSRRPVLSPLHNCVDRSHVLLQLLLLLLYTGKHSTHSQQQHQYFTKSAKQITPNRKLWLTKPNNKKNLCCYGTLQCYFLPYLAMWWIVAPYSKPTSKYNFRKSNTVQSHCFDRIHSDRPHRPSEALKFQNRQQAQGTSSSRRKLRLLVHLLAWQKPSQSKHKQLETQIISFCCTTDYELLRRLVETLSCDILQMTQWRTVVSGTWKYDDPRL